MNKLFTLSCLFFSFLFLSSHVDISNFVLNQYLGGDLNPILPDDPYNYEDQDFPEHIQFTDWGTNDTTILDLVTDDGATLGRVLFFDEKLSANENLSCGTCHKQAKSFADDTPFSMGVSENTKRNSMQLNDLGWTNRVGFFWDMSENDLQSMISLPLQNENEIGVTDIDQLIDKLNDTDYYPALFTKAFGDSEISEDRIADALTQFISSMTTFNSKFDRSHLDESILSESEIRGAQIFKQACETCHVDGNSFFFFDGLFLEFPFLFNNGLVETDDVGAGEVFGEEFDHLFKIPTLRNIVQTAPYMHDGQFETLEEVIDHYSEDLEPNEWTGEFIPDGGFQFTDMQKTDLLNFMETLTDEEFLVNEKWSDPFDRQTDTSGEEIVKSVRLFPNPTSDFAIIETINPNQKMVEAILYDNQGRFIKKMSSHNQQILFDVSQLETGIYYVNLNCEEFSQSVSLSVI